MDAVTALIAIVLVVIGLTFAALAGRRKNHLETFGVTPENERWVAVRDGYRIEVRRDMLFVVRLQTRPLPYERMVRALGRGELLAELFAFEARAAETQLEGRLPQGRARDVARALGRLTKLCATLEGLPIAESLSRHYLELGDGIDPTGELERLLTHCPDAPETLAVCRHELEVRRHPTLTAMAETHLARRSQNVATRLG